MTSTAHLPVQRHEQLGILYTQWHRVLPPQIPAQVGAIDFAVTYVVEALDLDSVVFFLEIKPPTHLPILSGRKDADNQMRQRFGQIAHLVKLPTLYGISAIGKSLCYYTYSVPTHTIEPTRILDSYTLLVDTAPLERWDSNIMEEEGHDRFLAMVQDIKSMINALW
ncbi:hypothetical protein BU17DRAFT_92000 [Hysterangium stoloniferum]|nr:hypothetical protein BU17DRAFT_92000 [Hysterangium stoloniferum]